MRGRLSALFPARLKDHNSNLVLSAVNSNTSAKHQKRICLVGSLNLKSLCCEAN